MVHTIEFHGRLQRADGRPVNPGRYALVFRLHATPDGDEPPLWEELLSQVPVAAGGFYHVVLGQGSRLDPRVFNGAARWMATHIQRDGRAGDPAGDRVPLTGGGLRIAAVLDTMADRLEAVERKAPIPLPTAHVSVAAADLVRRRTVKLHRRLRRLESGGGAIQALASRISAIEGRLARLDGEDGRLMRIEDELEDLVGPDGDVIDLNERMDRIEGRAPELIASLSRLRPVEETAPQRMRAAEERVASLERRLIAVEARPTAAVTTAESLGAVRKTGDSMYGPLIVQKGGINVVSGGIKTRGAEVNTLDVENVVTAPKVIADAIELRGDLTVDNTKRALQVRNVEGRAGSGRKDGPLHLNGRSGEEVVVGRAEESAGLQVHGVVRASRFGGRGSSIAETFECTEVLQPGEIARAVDGRTVARVDVEGDRRVVGVVVDDPGVLLGEGKVRVAIAGTARCKVVGAVAVGDLLVASAVAGHARAGEGAGAIVGKALSSVNGGASGDGKAEVLALIMAR